MAAFGAFCCVCSALMSFYVKKIGPRILIRKHFIINFTSDRKLKYSFDFSNMVDSRITLLLSYRFFGGLLSDCNSVYTISKLQYHWIDCYSHFSNTVSHQCESNGHLLHIYVRSIWLSSWRQFGWIVTRK